MDKIPVKTLEHKGEFQIWNLEDLPEEERLAVQNAVAAYGESTNSEFRAGACAVAFNGERMVKHNHTSEPGKGQEGHAEMLALDGLYREVNPAGRRLKIMALAASYPDQELIRSEEKYDANATFQTLHTIDAPRICGRCLKMMSDYTGNNLPDMNEKGEPVEPWDPIILILTGTGQVLRTTLSTLYPMPHVPHQTDIDPWNKKKKKAEAPDSYSSGK
jgi:cytidine deaminase